MNIGTMEQVRRDMESGVTDYTRNGECSSCGQCCANNLPLTVKECKRIREYVRRKGIKECVNLPPTSSPVIDFTCPFRDNARKVCTIYDVRPEVCRTFLCNKSREELRQNRYMHNRHHILVDMRETFFPKEDANGENR